MKSTTRLPWKSEYTDIVSGYVLPWGALVNWYTFKWKIGQVDIHDFILLTFPIGDIRNINSVD
jgi:hypothetical protein